MGCECLNRCREERKKPFFVFLILYFCFLLLQMIKSCSL